MEDLKLAAATRALEYVGKGMAIGLGTGSTAEVFIDLLGKKNKKEKLGITCIATSEASEKQARRLGLKIAGFGKLERIDAAFDGADQVDGQLNLIKGLGGALVREKIVDYRADRFVVMVGENKLVAKLGGIVPVEAIPLSEEAVRRDLLCLGAKSAETRMDGGRKFKSDNGNVIIHAFFEKIDEPQCLEDAINKIPGVVDNGIFSWKKPLVIVGKKGGAYKMGD